MRKFLLVLFLLALNCNVATARERVWGWCSRGSVQLTVGGVGLIPVGALAVYPSCVVEVFVSGTTTHPAAIYQDNLVPASPLANPFTASGVGTDGRPNGYFEFYPPGGRYDVRVSGGTPAPGISPPYTFGDIEVCDAFGPNPDPACQSGSPTAVTWEHNGAIVGVEPAWNIIDGSGVTVSLTNEPSANPPRVDLTLTAAGGSAAPCTTTTTGTWANATDVTPPQTCAGEKELDGQTGSAAVRNLTLIPASDETAPNSWLGVLAPSFTTLNWATLSGNVEAPLTTSWNVATALNQGAFGVSGFLGYNEASEAHVDLFGVRCGAVGKGSAGTGTIQACRGDAVNDGVGSQFVDGVSGFANNIATGTTGVLAGLYAGRGTNHNSTAHSVLDSVGVWIESQQNPDTGTDTANAWYYDIIPPAFVDADAQAQLANLTLTGNQNTIVTLAGYVKMAEDTEPGPAGAANNDILYPNKTIHRVQMNNNNAGYQTIAALSEVPQVYDISGSIQATPHIVKGTCTLGTNCAVTMSGAAIFTSDTSYVCTASDKTAQNPVQVLNASGSQFAITGTGTDVIDFVCIGN